MNSRFNDENLRSNDFKTEVNVHCPKCGKKALATVDYEKKKARLLCSFCGYNKTVESMTEFLGSINYFQVAASSYFGADLWYVAPFKDDYFISLQPTQMIREWSAINY